MRQELEKLSCLISRLLERTEGHGSRISIKEAAERASVSRRTLWRWMDAYDRGGNGLAYALVGG